jgi:addiction module HigA family antidote
VFFRCNGGLQISEVKLKKPYFFHSSRNRSNCLNGLNDLNHERTDKEKSMNSNKFSMVHPGRILLEEFLAPRGISVWHLARELGLPARQVYEIVQGQRSIVADTARRLAHYFGLSERFWLRLQAAYDLDLRNARLRGRDQPDASERLGVPRIWQCRPTLGETVRQLLDSNF